MIEVRDLSKHYPGQPAIRGITFQVGPGEVVGFLGPNGAGKSTTMKILTTFLAPSSGRARVQGHDVVDEPLAVRRSLGYLPENIPLYGEMRVVEYLLFRARLKDLPRRDRLRSIGESLERTGLVDQQRRIIGQLSRGYRQRVGLADALLGDPALLILDEPTSGLDPIQVREVRDLIRDLGGRHTILLSTHILGEVEAVCDRVILLARGRIALDETLESIQGGRSIQVRARGPEASLHALLTATPGVGEVIYRGRDGDEECFEVVAVGGQDLREVVAARVVGAGHGLRALVTPRSSLEDRFVRAVTETRASTAATAGSIAEAGAA